MNEGSRIRFAGSMSSDVLERARNAVFYTPGMTLSDLMEEAVRRYVAGMERKRGKPFPKRTAPLKTGRPMMK